MTQHLLLIADSDSQLLAARALALATRGLGARATINAVPRIGTPAALLESLEREGPLWNLRVGQLLTDSCLEEFTAIGVYLTGSKLAEFRSLYLISRQERKLPIQPLFCGFNGVVLERFEEAIAWRLGYDVICLNGPRDQERLERILRDTPFAEQRTAITGLQRQGEKTLNNITGSKIERTRQLIFAEQVVMPAAQTERRQMLQLLARLARRSPHWQVLIKPRVAPSETTFHTVERHISDTLREALGSPPANLKLSYTPLNQLLRESQLLATVSSTAVFDALDLGCQPVVMADFGLRQDLGTPFFAGSGVLRRFAEAEDLDDLASGLTINPTWLHWVGYHPDFNAFNLLQALEARSSAPRKPMVLQQPGYVINAADLSTNQLRRGAETAIRNRDYDEAERRLEIAQLQRPGHRNIQRRLQAVRCRNRLLRRLLLLVTPGFRD